MMTFLVFLACLYIVAHNIFCIARMQPHTAWSVFIWHALLSVGAFSMCLQILVGFEPDTPTLLIVLGIAGKYMLERRHRGHAESAA